MTKASISQPSILWNLILLGLSGKIKFLKVQIDNRGETDFYCNFADLALLSHKYVVYVFLELFSCSVYVTLVRADK